MKHGALKIALLYFVISLLWVVLSDKVLFLIGISRHPGVIYLLSTFKGFLFISATAATLYFLIRKNEKDLLSNEIRYREIYETNPNPMWIYDPQTLRFVSVNDAALAKYGYTRAEFMRMSILNIHLPEDHERALQDVNNNGDALFHNKGTWQHLTKGGKRLYVNLTLNTIILNDRINYMVLVRDITESVENETRLKEMVDRYELAAKATKDVLYDFDILDNNLTYNDNLYKLINTPVSPKSSTLEWWRNLIHPDDIASVVSTQKAAIAHKKSTWECEYRISNGDGTYKYVYDQAYMMFNDEQRPVRMIGAIKDIDAIKISEKENKRLASIITNINNMVLITDKEWRIVWVNNAFENFTGYMPNEISGKFLHFMASADDRELIENILHKNLNKWLPFAADMHCTTKAGIPYWVYAEFTPMFDDKGAETGYISVQSDITLRKDKETEVERQIHTLKHIAWMSSHQLRKPVATILGLINLIEMHPSADEMAELAVHLKTATLELDTIVHEINFEVFNSIDPTANTD